MSKTETETHRASIEAQTKIVGVSDALNTIRATSKRVEPSAAMMLAVTMNAMSTHLADRIKRLLEEQNTSVITPSIFNEALREMRDKRVLPVLLTAPDGDTERMRNADHTKMLVDRRIKADKKKAIKGEDAGSVAILTKAKMAKEELKKRARAEEETESAPAEKPQKRRRRKEAEAENAEE